MSLNSKPIILLSGLLVINYVETSWVELISSLKSDCQPPSLADDGGENILSLHLPSKIQMSLKKKTYKVYNLGTKVNYAICWRSALVYKQMFPDCVPYQGREYVVPMVLVCDITSIIQYVKQCSSVNIVVGSMSCCWVRDKPVT